MICKCKVKPYDGNEPYIFFSYCHKDAERVYPVIETLACKGYRIWYDEGIHPGDDWPEVIAQHLADANICIVAITESSTKSHNCRNEMTFAIENEKHLISLKFDKFLLPLGIKLQLSSTQIIKVYEYAENRFYEKLYSSECLKDCLGKPQKIIIPEISQNKHETFHKFEKVSEKKVQKSEIIKHDDLKMNSFNKVEIKQTENKTIEELNKQKEELQRKIAEIDCFSNLEKERQEKIAEIERIRNEELQNQKAEAERVFEELSKNNKSFNDSEDETVMNSDDETIMDLNDDLTEFDNGNGEDGFTQLENIGIPPILVQLSTNTVFIGNSPLTSIGRSRNESDIYFESKNTISSHHADIVIHDGRNFLVDHNSSNHTYVNGKMLEKNESYEIQNYAEISLSHSEKFFLAFGEYAERVLENMYLTSLLSVETHEKLYFFENESILGRSYPWASGAMSDKTIGRQHAILQISKEECLITDQSKNGTYINGKKIEKGTSTLLNNGDKIRFGRENFIFNHVILIHGDDIQ